MLNILKFVFTDWKTFWGTVLLIILSECVIIPILTIIRYINKKVFRNIKRWKRRKWEDL